MPRRLLLIALVACGGGAPRPPQQPGPVVAEAADPDGPHRIAVAAQVKPFLDAELVSGVVVGLYDAGKLEIYGFGVGPGGKPPTGATLFEIGSITKAYTSLLFADAVQRREVAIDTPVSELLPPGVTVPTKDQVAITLHHLATHTSGLPRLPPSLVPHAAEPDPYAGYGEEALYQDLIHTELQVVPGTRTDYSNYGVGLLGVALGRKIGGGYGAALRARVLEPLGLRDTYVTVPAQLALRRAQGTTDDLQPTPPWTFDAIAGAGALVSTARDQLKLIDAELDAAAGSRAPLRAPMRLTQERVDGGGRPAGLGWLIDGSDRYWHNGGTGGFHSFLGFDPRTRRGIVILASTSSSLIDRLADSLYQVLEGTAPTAAAFPDAQVLATVAGSYDLAGIKLQIIADGKRLYVEGQGEPRHRMLPISDHEFLIEALQAVAIFEKEGDKVARVVFSIGNQQITAPRLN